MDFVFVVVVVVVVVVALWVAKFSIETASPEGFAEGARRSL